MTEDALPGFDVSGWYAFFVPAKTPPEIVQKMHADTAAVLAEPAIKATAGGARPGGGRLDARRARTLS